MIAGILIALLVTVIVCALTTFGLRKLEISPEFRWIVWLVVIILIVYVWWTQVLGALIGPLP